MILHDRDRLVEPTACHRLRGWDRREVDVGSGSLLARMP